MTTLDLSRNRLRMRMTKNENDDTNWCKDDTMNDTKHSQKNEAMAWQKCVDPRTGRAVYYAMNPNQHDSSTAASKCYVRCDAPPHSNSRNSLASSLSSSDTQMNPYVTNVTTPSSFLESLLLRKKYFNLTCLKVNHNTIESLPESIGSLTQLEVLECQWNKLRCFPQGLVKLSKLRVLKADHNFIENLPRIDEASTMVISVLSLSNNHFKIIPPCICKWQSLTHINFNNNRIQYIPCVIGALISLKKLHMHNNPLIDPPYSFVLDGCDRLIWICRERFASIEKGSCPQVCQIYSGINNEVCEIHPIYESRVDCAIKDALTSQNKKLILQNYGLKKSPRGFKCLDGLRYLDISHNPFGASNISLNWSFSSLLGFQSRHCGLLEFPRSIELLYNLKDLNLSHNSIREIPKELFLIPNLEKINLSYNRIEEVSFKVPMKQLKILLMDGNKLASMPSNMFNLSSLNVVSLKNNIMHQIQKVEIDHMPKSIYHLDISRNEIHHVTSHIGNLALKELYLHCNHIQCLCSDFLFPNLITTLRSLRIDNNYLTELPSCVLQVESTLNMKFDFNPYLFPPPAVARRGQDAMITFCKGARSRAINLQQALLVKGIATQLEHYFPYPRSIIEQKSIEFLTLEDCLVFEDKVSSYLRGYLNDTEIDIVNEICAIKSERESTIYRAILESLLLVLNDNEVLSYMINGNMIRFNLAKPWGKDNEHVSCVCFPLDIMHDYRENIPGKDMNILKFLFSIVKRECSLACNLQCELTYETLLRVIKIIGPYGSVASIEHISYSDSNLFDDVSCRILSFVIAKHIYTCSEAKRRAREENEAYKLFLAIERKIHSWLTTDEGIKMVDREVFRRFEDSHKQLRESRIMLRELLFNENKLESLVESNPSMLPSETRKGEEQLRLLRQDIVKLKETVSEKQISINTSDYEAIRETVICDLKFKCYGEVYLHLRNDLRRESYKQGLCRPWDVDFQTSNVTHQGSHETFEEIYAVYQDIEKWFSPNWTLTASLNEYETSLYRKHANSTSVKLNAQFRKKSSKFPNLRRSFLNLAIKSKLLLYLSLSFL